MRKEFLKKLLYITISTFAVLVLLEISSIFISGYAYQKHGKDALRIGVKYSKDVISRLSDFLTHTVLQAQIMIFSQDHLSDSNTQNLQ